MEEDIKPQEVSHLKPVSDTLLVLNINTNTVEMVKGVDKDGNLQKLPPEEKKDNEQLIRVDKHGDVFSNFFSNFYRQLKNPSHFNFFKVSEYDAVNTAKELQQYIDQASPAELEKLKEYIVSTKNNNNIKNSNTMEQTNKDNQEYRFQPEQIDWKTMGKFGLNQEKLEKMNALDPLLRGFKTNNLVPITINLGTAVSRMDVRLSLQTADNGEVAVHLHGIRKEPNLNLKFLGHEFSEEDKKNLRESGNMGRVVNLVNPKTDEIIPSIISRDRLTNELVAYKTEYMKIPDEIKGVKLDEHQQQILSEGKPLYLEGMTSKKGELFNATVQFNADKRYVEFLFNNNQSQQLTQPKNQSGQTFQNKDGEAPKVFRGHELDDKKYEKFKAGETVYVDGLADGKGKAYQGYITFNKETSKTDFSFTNPNKLKEKSQPSEDNKTQKAVNSDGKTNEATKNLKEPLQPKQQQPANKQQEDQQNKPAKSKGRKM
ncbi:DUF3945 domain-containing protein [Chryseobacterium balustinum]|uniref:DUF3945 domain-containing protein n=1 Tax=Chryseobacterium balustinum TaxID=246 RepID=A0AAX2IMV7_9FLAO|nr:DUF3945 domain-containing protein [Chryseobacterium balustinum]AZB30288.1 DUF3945 domain-containing protein [Chryseobacterium balustinum]SKC03212.1 Protein of unknown function [Chryseobacterium balustinum]SQA90924.1 Uncharacterised protein [Chryseobacterium balustinum]